jgi:hypothetical protein
MNNFLILLQGKEKSCNFGKRKYTKDKGIMINRMKIKKQKLLKRVNCKKMEKELEDMITGCKKGKKKMNIPNSINKGK